MSSRDQLTAGPTHRPGVWLCRHENQLVAGPSHQTGGTMLPCDQLVAGPNYQAGVTLGRNVTSWSSVPLIRLVERCVM